MFASTMYPANDEIAEFIRQKLFTMSRELDLIRHLLYEMKIMKYVFDITIGNGPKRESHINHENYLNNQLTTVCTTTICAYSVRYSIQLF